jgi:hypothetical protein
MTEVTPCRVCGSPVRVELIHGKPRSTGQTDVREHRVCTNPTCRTNLPPSKRRMADRP